MPEELKKVFAAKVKFNFMRGRQMIVWDPRVPAVSYENGVCTPVPSLPAAMNQFKVSAAARIENIVGWVAKVAKGDTGDKKLDALHIVAHGSATEVQLGAGLILSNTSAFSVLENLVRGAVVFHSCAVASSFGGPSHYNRPLAELVARYVKCPAIAAVGEQRMHDDDGKIDLSNFEGLVIEYRPDGSKIVHNMFGGFDMAKVIFRPQ